MYARYLEEIEAPKAEGSVKGKPVEVEQRRGVWDATWGQAGEVGDIVGPFEIQLPSYLPMEQYIGAKDLEAIQELLPLGLAIRLNTGSRRLSLGFSKLGGPEKVGVRFGLLSVWVHIRGWLRLIYQGYPVRLRSHLMVVLSAGTMDVVPVEGDGGFFDDYTRANENAITLRERLSKGLEIHMAAEAEVDALIKGTLGDVRVSLETWALSNGREEASLRVGVAASIWLSHCDPAEREKVQGWGKAWQQLLSVSST